MSGDVTIRACVANDAPALAAMYAADRADVLVSEPSPVPFFTVAGQLERITRIGPEHDCLGFVVVVDGQVVGLMVLEDVADRSATVGYYISAAARGRGVATAALGALVQVALHDVGLVRLVADIDPGNVASRCVVERNGFRSSGRCAIRPGCSICVRLSRECSGDCGRVTPRVGRRRARRETPDRIRVCRRATGCTRMK